MDWDPELMEILRCPQCKGPLQEEASPAGFSCATCRVRFPVVDGIPNFVPAHAIALDDESPTQ